LFSIINTYIFISGVNTLKKIMSLIKINWPEELYFFFVIVESFIKKMTTKIIALLILDEQAEKKKA